MSSPSIAAIASAAAAKLEQDVVRLMPGIWPALRSWCDPRTLAIGGLEPRSFPALLLPFWVAPEWRDDDQRFWLDLTGSTLHGYLFLRLIDDVTDGDRGDSLRRLLPLAGYFSSRFQELYHNHFSSSDPFWHYFRSFWATQAIVSTEDSLSTSISRDRFLHVSSLKSSASKIPAAAAALRHGKEDRLALWLSTIDQLGALQQFANDFFGCYHDLEHGIDTFVLSIYRQESTNEETLADWLLTHGFAWGVSELRSHLAILDSGSKVLKSIEFSSWLQGKSLRVALDINQASYRVIRRYRLPHRWPYGTSMNIT
ncbi:MAG: hypothetical protein ACWA6X_05910 [Bauldia sp.]